jgi:hypothetical protein
MDLFDSGHGACICPTRRFPNARWPAPVVRAWCNVRTAKCVVHTPKSSAGVQHVPDINTSRSSGRDFSEGRRDRDRVCPTGRELCLSISCITVVRAELSPGSLRSE